MPWIRSHRLHFLPADAERPDDGEELDAAGSPPPRWPLRLERVGERAADVGNVAIVAVAGHRARCSDVVAPDFVQPEDVIGMAVREEDGVEPADVMRQRLRAQIGPRVHQQPAVVVGRNVAPRYASGDRADRWSGRSRSRSRSSARRVTCRFRGT